MGGGVLKISSDGDDRMEAKIKKKPNSLRFPAKPKKIPGPLEQHFRLPSQSQSMEHSSTSDTHSSGGARNGHVPFFTFPTKFASIRFSFCTEVNAHETNIGMAFMQLHSGLGALAIRLESVWPLTDLVI